MTRVTISTRPVGQSFGCVGVIRSWRTGRVLAETDVAPHGYDSVAAQRAERLATERGYTVVQSEDE